MRRVGGWEHGWDECFTAFETARARNSCEWIHRLAGAARRVTHPAAAEVHLYLEDGLLKATGIMRMQVAQRTYGPSCLDLAPYTSKNAN